MNTKENVSAVVLAAGKGTRMKSDSPKVAIKLQGKPLICHVVENLNQAGISDITIIVGYKKEEVMSLCSSYPNVKFAVQEEQLGTGHALLCAEKNFSNYHGSLIVACGDVPLISSNTFQSLIQIHSKNGNATTVLSAELDNPFGYGRIVRDASGAILEIVEEKDANSEQKQISEINTGTYCFNSPEVFSYLKKIGKENAQGEYYLPDLIKLYNREGKSSGAVKLQNSFESHGVNSPEDLERIQAYLDNQRPRN
ncbi:MAG: NTP transferase domain-containing protein [Leptospiraceae bacterium]|nr:NTP transferase domain-containing protein [Leptospiraceae bacterium]